MGQRYIKIVKAAGHTVISLDIEDYLEDIQPTAYSRGVTSWLKKCSKVIIATPTDTHIEICRLCEEYNVKYLCEKPISFNPEELKGLTGSMVCNWAYVIPNTVLKPRENNVYYNYHKTGPHGKIWDCIQLLHLSSKINKRDISRFIKNDAPNFTAIINNHIITLDMIEDSYTRMIQDWLNDSPNIWTIQSTINTHKTISKQTQII